MSQKIFGNLYLGLTGDGQLSGSDPRAPPAILTRTSSQNLCVPFQELTGWTNQTGELESDHNKKTNSSLNKGIEDSSPLQSYFSLRRSHLEISTYQSVSTWLWRGHSPQCRSLSGLLSAFPGCTGFEDSSVCSSHRLLKIAPF